MLALFVTAGCGGNDSTSITMTENPGSGGSNQTSQTDPSGDPTSGATENGGATETGGGPAPSREVCDRYLECLSVTAPADLPAAQQGFGEDGTCWQGTPAEQQQCIAACQVALEQAHGFHKDEPKCALCDTQAECTAGLQCVMGECRPPNCGDGMVDADEVCDDDDFDNFCDDNCLGPAACNPLTGAGCDADLYCLVDVNASEQVSCVPEQRSAAEGEPCESSVCAEGLTCFFCEVDYCCRRLCDINADDCGTDSCIPFMAMFEDSPPELWNYLGICS